MRPSEIVTSGLALYTSMRHVLGAGLTPRFPFGLQLRSQVLDVGFVLLQFHASFGSPLCGLPCSVCHFLAKNLKLVSLCQRARRPLVISKSGLLPGLLKGEPGSLFCSI